MLKRPNFALNPARTVVAREDGYMSVSLWWFDRDCTEEFCKFDVPGISVTGLHFAGDDELWVLSGDGILSGWDISGVMQQAHAALRVEEAADDDVVEAEFVEPNEDDVGEDSVDEVESKVDGESPPQTPRRKWRVRLNGDFTTTTFNLGKLAAGDGVGRVWLMEREGDGVRVRVGTHRHRDSILALRFSRDGSRLASAGRDRRIRIWDVEERREGLSEVSLVSPSEVLQFFAVDESTESVEEVSTGDVLEFFSVPENDSGPVSEGPDSEQPDDEAVAESTVEAKSSAQKTGARPAPLVCVQSFRGMEGWPISLAFSHDRKWLVSGGMDQGLYLWELGGESLQPSQVRFAHSGWVADVAWSDGDEVIATGSWDTTVGLFDGRTLEPLVCLELHRDYVADVEFVGERLLAASHDREISVWDWRERTLDTMLQGHTDWVDILEPLDERSVASFGSDQTILVWDVVDGSLLRRIGRVDQSAGFEVGAPVDLSEYVDTTSLASYSMERERPGRQYRDYRASGFRQSGDQTALALLEKNIEQEPSEESSASSLLDIPVSEARADFVPDVDVPTADPAVFEDSDVAPVANAVIDDAAIDEAFGVSSVPETGEWADGMELDDPPPAEEIVAGAELETVEAPRTPAPVEEPDNKPESVEHPELETVEAPRTPPPVDEPDDDPVPPVEEPDEGPPIEEPDEPPPVEEPDEPPPVEEPVAKPRAASNGQSAAAISESNSVSEVSETDTRTKRGFQSSRLETGSEFADDAGSPGVSRGRESSITSFDAGDSIEMLTMELGDETSSRFESLEAAQAFEPLADPPSVEMADLGGFDEMSEAAVDSGDEVEQRVDPSVFRTHSWPKPRIEDADKDKLVEQTGEWETSLGEFDPDEPIKGLEPAADEAPRDSSGQSSEELRQQSDAVSDAPSADIWERLPSRSTPRKELLKRRSVPGAVKFERTHSIKTPHEFVYGVAISPDGTRIATCGGDNSMCVWTRSGDLVHRVRVKGDGLNAIAFSLDGRAIVAGGDDCVVHLWLLPPDDEPGAPIQHAPLRGHDGWIASVSFSADGSFVFTGSYDGTACVWRLSSGKCVRRLTGHEGAVAGVAIGTNRAYTVGHDGALSVWNQRWVQVDLVSGHDRLLGVSSNGDTTAFCAANGDVFTLRDGHPIPLLRHRGQARAVRVRGDGVLFSVGEDGHLRVYPHGADAPTQSLPVPSPLWCVDARLDIAAVGADDGFVYLFGGIES